MAESTSTQVLTATQVVDLLKKNPVDPDGIADQYWNMRYVSVTNPKPLVKHPNLDNPRLMGLIAEHELAVKNAYLNFVDKIRAVFTDEEIMVIWNNIHPAIRDEMVV